MGLVAFLFTYTKISKKEKKYYAQKHFEGQLQICDRQQSFPGSVETASQADKL
jgi:hypothetical protein